jgi:hypothetical protein
MRRPAKLPVNYSFRAAQESGAFDQLALLSADQFGKAAKERGVNVSFGNSLRDKLEELDKIGSLSPVLFDGADGEPVFREEQDFVPWSEYQVDEDFYSRAKPYYCHWHLLYIEDAVSGGTVEVTLDWLLDDEQRATVGDGYRAWYTRQDEARRSLDAHWRTLLLLLVRIQNRYAPLIKGTLTKATSTLVFDPEVGDYVDPFTRTARSFDPQSVLDELGLTSENVAEFQSWIGWHGLTQDPVERWHMLLRMTSYRERSKLSDGARRAHDAYDAAEILRRFYHDLTGELLLNPDEISDASDKSWKKRLFGRWPFLSYTRRDLQAELRRHDLWPHHIHLVVEGATEEIVCTRILETLAGRPLADIGVTLATLGGVGKTRLHQEMLRVTSGFARWAILIADREGDIERDVDLMRQEGILSDDTCLLWRRSFEEDNFTDDELVTMLTDLARDAGVSLDLDAKSFRSAYDKQRAQVGAKAKGALTYLLGMARDPARGGFNPGKTPVAEKMADLLLADLDERSEVALEERPILKLLVSIIRVT